MTRVLPYFLIMHYFSSFSLFFFFFSTSVFFPQNPHPLLESNIPFFVSPLLRGGPRFLPSPSFFSSPFFFLPHGYRWSARLFSIPSQHALEQGVIHCKMTKLLPARHWRTVDESQSLEKVVVFTMSFFLYLTSIFGKLGVKILSSSREIQR